MDVPSTQPSIIKVIGVGGGGGKCEFDQGLGSFEALYAGQIYSNIVKQLAKSIEPALIAQGMPEELASIQANEM